MIEWDFSRAWYHGSPRELIVLRAGSSITQDIDIARVFSHRPSLISMSEDRIIKHNGTVSGYLYLVAEEVKPEDVYPHPHPANVGYWEWLIKRELRVKLIERTEIKAAEQLTDEEIAELRYKQKAAGAESFTE